MTLTLIKSGCKSRNRRNIDAILKDENGNIIFSDFINHYTIVNQDTGFIILVYGKNKQISFNHVKIIEV